MWLRTALMSGRERDRTLHCVEHSTVRAPATCAKVRCRRQAYHRQCGVSAYGMFVAALSSRLIRSSVHPRAWIAGSISLARVSASLIPKVV